MENNIPVSTAYLKQIVQQFLCLLGSANTQLSILRRKKILASINKSKIELATQPLPNAKRWLFGDDFPSIASKEAELLRGLAKNLAPSGSKFNVQDPKRQSGNFNPGNFNSASKYRAQTKRDGFFVPPRFAPSGRQITTPHQTVAKSDIRPIYSRHYYWFKNSFSFGASSKDTTNFSNLSRVRDINGQGNLETFSKRGNLRSPVHNECFLQPNISSPNEGQRHETGYRSKHTKSIHRTSTFSDGTSLLNKNSSATGLLYNKIGPERCISFSANPSRFTKVRFLWKNKTYQFKALPFGLNIAPMIFIPTIC